MHEARTCFLKTKAEGLPFQGPHSPRPAQRTSIPRRCSGCQEHLPADPWEKSTTLQSCKAHDSFDTRISNHPSPLNSQQVLCSESMHFQEVQKPCQLHDLEFKSRSLLLVICCKPCVAVQVQTHLRALPEVLCTGSSRGDKPLASA